MAEYIERDAAVDAIVSVYVRTAGYKTRECVWTAKEAVCALPTAAVALVVRCKDCRYWQDNNGGYPRGECKWRGDETPDADDYCSAGERE